MNPLWVLLIAIIIVVGGVLVLRLHAFLALILGALTVAALTPAEWVYGNELRRAAVGVVSMDPDAGAAVLDAGPGDGATDGTALRVLRHDPAAGTYEPVGELIVIGMTPDGRAIAQPADAETLIEMRPRDIVIHPMREREARSVANDTMGERIAAGFGRTALGIGILIAMAAIIGKCLLESGAAERVVLSARRLVGERNTPLAFVGSGFIVAIPVFFDTVFYLLLPLGKAMRLRTGRNYLLYVMTIVAGATMAHSLVPPTPGPLFVANELGVDIGLMMIGGVILGLFTAGSGYLYALWANRMWEVPLRESAELTRPELEAMRDRDEALLPPLWLSLLPILLPVVLIAGATVLSLAYAGVEEADLPGWHAVVAPLVEVLGDKNIALIVAAAVALGMLMRQKRTSRLELTASVQTALASGGVIILITSAGGAFGHVLQQTGIAGYIEQAMPATQAALLPIAFLITAVVRIAQGSATVAMITAVSVVAPLAVAGDIGFHPLYLALAIGCGSKPIPWMNDSGFWIISKMAGMSEGETLKSISVMMTLMGIVGLLVIMVAAYLLPLV